MSRQFVLFPGETGWRIAIVGENVEFRTADSPTEVADILSNYPEPPAVWLALLSHDCLCAMVSTAGLARHAGEALKYRLEETFPWSAEEFVAVESRTDSDQAFVVATRRSTLDANVAALLAAGISVRGASPAALLAVNRVCEPSTDAIVLREESPGSISLIQVRNRQPIAWNVLADDAGQLHDRLGEDRALRLVVVGDIKAATPTRRDETIESLAAVEAARVVRRESKTSFNLLQTQRSRPTAMWAAMVCAAMLLGICGGLLWRTGHYNRDAARSDEVVRATFGRVFPGTPLPAGVVSRLLGEVRSMRAAAGTTGDVPQQTQVITPTLATTLNALGSLPESTRFSVDDLTVDARHVAITGQAALLADAQSIADALHAIHGWTVDPPRTEQRLAAVNFTVQATAPMASQSPLAAGGTLP